MKYPTNSYGQNSYQIWCKNGPIPPVKTRVQPVEPDELDGDVVEGVVRGGLVTGSSTESGSAAVSGGRRNRIFRQFHNQTSNQLNLKPVTAMLNNITTHHLAPPSGLSHAIDSHLAIPDE